MKNCIYLLVLTLFITSCTSQKNSEEFIDKTTGRYLFNANEILEIYFENAEMHAKWRGNDDIELLKINDSAFYMRALNEKMLFVSKPEMHIELAPKTEHDGVKYYFKKLAKDEKTPSEYLDDNEYEKALLAFKTIKERDSLNPTVQESYLRRMANNLVDVEKYDKAIQVYKINTELYPKHSRAFSALAFGYWQKKDTVNTLKYYNKALEINPENVWALRFFKENKFD